MFDHSELLNNRTVAKALVLTDTYVAPEPVTRKELIRFLIDLHASVGITIPEDPSDLDVDNSTLIPRRVIGRFTGRPPTV